MANIIDVDQGSPGWHNLRNMKIGSSDVPIILWMDPWGNTPFGLWQIKTGRKKHSDWQGKEAKAHGKATEEHARNQAAGLLGDFFAPAVLTCDEPDLNFMLASLDGINPEMTEILEVKCPVEIGTHLQAKEGRVDDHYYAQIQHQLYVSKAKVAHFFSWFACPACKGKGEACEVCKGLGGDGVMVAVEPDAKFQAEMIAAEKEFWGWVFHNKFPMPEGEIEITDKDTIAAARGYAQTIKEIRELEDIQRKFKAKILKAAPDKKRVRVGPLEIAWTFRGGYTEKQPRTVSDSLSCTIRRVTAEE